MKSGLKAAAIAVLMTAASPALSATLTFTGTMAPYSGNRAYAVVYLVDSSGKYVGTIHVAGRKSKYLRHMSRWNRMFARAGGRVDGTTGASVGSGQSFTSQVKISDRMIDSGFVLRVETAVENRNYFANDVELPLTSSNNGKVAFGNGYVDTFKFNF